MVELIDIISLELMIFYFEKSFLMDILNRISHSAG
jgi:hypothetical protein